MMRVEGVELSVPPYDVPRGKRVLVRDLQPSRFHQILHFQTSYLPCQHPVCGTLSIYSTDLLSGRTTNSVLFTI